MAVARATPATDEVLRHVAAATGVALTADGACRGGVLGAAYVCWPDGHRSVLTCQPDHPIERVRRTAMLLDRVRNAGLPVARYELVVQTPAAVAVIQQLLPGRTPDPVDRRTIASMVELNARCRGLLAVDTDLSPVQLYLLTDGPNMCLHEPLARYGPQTARLLDWIHEVGVTSPTHLAGSDLVHGDFHPDNVLVNESGVVTALVDWDEVGRGDGRFDLVYLRFELGWRDPRLGHWLDGQLREIVPGELLRACWAHVSLRAVDFAIRHQTAAEVTAWLKVAELYAFA